MAQAQQTKIAQVTLTQTKETKNTIRFDGPAPVSQLYVDKSAFGAGGYPAQITVTITVAS